MDKTQIFLSFKYSLFIKTKSAEILRHSSFSLLNDYRDLYNAGLEAAGFAKVDVFLGGGDAVEDGLQALAVLQLPDPVCLFSGISGPVQHGQVEGFHHIGEGALRALEFLAGGELIDDISGGLAAGRKILTPGFEFFRGGFTAKDVLIATGNEGVNQVRILLVAQGRGSGGVDVVVVIAQLAQLLAAEVAGGSVVVIEAFVCTFVQVEIGV